MSIVDSPADRQEAVQRVAAKTDEALRVDLEYWTLAAFDHVAEYRELTNRQVHLSRLHNEEEAWVGLIVEEIRRRRTPGSGS